MKDIPLRPEELGAYWVEYVVRHGGAPHLKSHGRLLRWWEYHLVDVWLFILAVLGSAVVVTYAFVKLAVKLVKIVFHIAAGPGTNEGNKSKTQ